MIQSETTFDLREPALLNDKMPLPLKYLQNGAATNGQVIAFNGTDNEWEPANAVSTVLTSAHIFVGNGSGLATDVPMSGDATMDNTGAVAVSKLTITGASTGDILIYSGGAWVRLPAGTMGQVLTMGASLPAWA